MSLTVDAERSVGAPDVHRKRKERVERMRWILQLGNKLFTNVELTTYSPGVSPQLFPLKCMARGYWGCQVECATDCGETWAVGGQQVSTAAVGRPSPGLAERRNAAYGRAIDSTGPLCYCALSSDFTASTHSCQGKLTYEHRSEPVLLSKKSSTPVCQFLRCTAWKSLLCLHCLYHDEFPSTLLAKLISTDRLVVHISGDHTLQK